MIKPVFPVVGHPFNSTIQNPVSACLGSRIQSQMFHGVSPGNSTLLSGQYDDESSFDVDPACDMSTDRFDLRVDSHALHSSSPGSVDSNSE